MHTPEEQKWISKNISAEIQKSMKEFRQRSGQILYRRPNGTMACDSFNPDPTMTQMQFTDDCDINKIMARAEAGHAIPVHQKTGYYLDCSDAKNYLDSLQIVLDADNAFAELNADVRARFNNDPAQLLKFLEDSKNKDEAIRLGLIPSPQESEISTLTNQLKQNLLKNDDSNDEIKEDKKSKKQN